MTREGRTARKGQRGKDDEARKERMAMLGKKGLRGKDGKERRDFLIRS